MFGAVYLLGFVAELPAQVSRVERYSPASNVDGYGNARPIYQDRRSAGVFQNDLQRRVLRSYQEGGRRQNRRGGFQPFILPNDRYFRNRAQRASGYRAPVQFGRMTQWQQRAFDRFGGATTSESGGGTSSISSLVDRQSALLAATTGTGPLHRALRDGEAAAPRLKALQGELTLSHRPRAGSTEPERKLEEWLRAGADSAYERLNADAWQSFRDGHYRRAARAFETLVVMHPDDLASRIGEIFSYVSLGMNKTAGASLTLLLRHDSSPWLAEIDLSDAYGDARELQRIRASVRVMAAGAAVPDPSAIIMLWYLGETDEALRLAESLARQRQEAPYADWPVEMRKVRQR